MPNTELIKAANETVRLSMLAGEVMLKNGAETYRVEDTMKRVLQNCGYEDAEAFVTTTGLFACVTADNIGAVTQVRRVKGRTINYDKVAKVNDLSRAIASGDVTVAEATARLNSITAAPLNSPFIRIFAAGVASAAFAYILRGGYEDCLNAFFTGLMLHVLIIPMRKSVPSVLVNILGGALISFLSLLLLNLGIGTEGNLDKIIIGSLMPMLPGVALTNAIRDVIEGDYISGSSQFIEAVIIAIALAVGIGTVLMFWMSQFGGFII